MTASTFERALAGFLVDFPGYGQNGALDDLRQRDFQRLDAGAQVYLDYTGGCLYPASLVQEHAELLLRSVLGNPHSQNPASLAATHRVEQARADVLDFFRADPDEYLVIFTANASGALKLLAESYPFSPHGCFVLAADNHNSVHGIREYARSRGSAITYIPLDPASLRAPDPTPSFEAAQTSSPRLFAFPAQSNFSGVQHPLEWVDTARAFGFDVLLDAAAFVPTNRLDLSRVRPDFVPISFYKMFGYPTGIGALIARRAALAGLRRPWFAGGTVQLVSTKADLHILAAGAAAFEEGTVNYLGLPAISNGLRFLNELGMETIHDRVLALVGYLLREMLALRHSNGVPLVHIYGPTETHQRGGTIAFNLSDPDGVLFPYHQVEAEANTAAISIRSGCFCNPGAGEYSLTHTAEEVRGCVEQSMVDGDFDITHFHDCLGNKATGAVRASVGLASNFADAYRFRDFLAGFLNRSAGSAAASSACS